MVKLLLIPSLLLVKEANQVSDFMPTSANERPRN